jgi:hypothetical protein
VLGGEGGEGEEVGGGGAPELGGGGEAVLELLDHPAVLGPDRRGRRLGEDRAHQRGDQGLGGSSHAGEQIAGEVGPAALPGGAGEHGGDGLLQALVVVGDDQAHAAQAPSHEITQARSGSSPDRAVQPAPSSLVITSHPGLRDNRLY